MKKFLILILLFIICGVPTLAKDKKSYPKPVVVTFLSKNCDECDALDMVKQAVEEEYSKKVGFINIDIDTDDEDYIFLMERYNINKAPVTLFLNSEKSITKKIADYIPYNQYVKNVKSITE